MDSRSRMQAVRAFETLADILLQSVFRIEVRGLENFTHSRSTLIVANHRRDSDGPVVCGVLLQRRGLRLRGVVPHFVAREDLFHKGFLADYLETWPRPVRSLLTRLDLSAFLRFMQAYPIRRIPERTLAEVLEAVRTHFGNLPLDEVLKRRWLEKFRAMTPGGREPLDVDHALAPRYRSLLRSRRGLARLTLRRFQALKPYERATIDSQLRLFVELLERGANVQLEPEGAVSADGRFSRLRGALHYLVNRPRAAVRVLPVGLTYDFMMRGRPRVFVNVGPEMTDLRGLGRREIDRRVADAIVERLTVTASHLASRLIMDARARVTAAVTVRELIDYVGTEAHRYARTGVFVDPRLLNHRSLCRRIRAYVDYCLNSGALLRSDRGRFRVGQGAGRPYPGWPEREADIDYVNNELSSLNQLRADTLESVEA